MPLLELLFQIALSSPANELGPISQLIGALALLVGAVGLMVYKFVEMKDRKKNGNGNGYHTSGTQEEALRDLAEVMGALKEKVERSQGDIAIINKWREDAPGKIREDISEHLAGFERILFRLEDRMNEKDKGKR